MHYSLACSRFGADMGRPSQHEHASDGAYKFKLALVPLNQGGYDPGGAYWGTPCNLYVAEYESDATHDSPNDVYRYTVFFMRANSRDAAKAEVRKRYPNARFYR